MLSWGMPGQSPLGHGGPSIVGLAGRVWLTMMQAAPPHCSAPLAVLDMLYNMVHCHGCAPLSGVWMHGFRGPWGQAVAADAVCAHRNGSTLGSTCAGVNGWHPSLVNQHQPLALTVDPLPEGWMAAWGIGRLPPPQARAHVGL